MARWISLLLVAFCWHTALANPVSIPTADGVSLAADLQGQGEHALLIVHDEGDTRVSWEAVASALSRGGLRVLRLDLRGHGASKGVADEAGWAHMGDDVVAALAWLRARDGVKHVAVMGAGAGAVLAAEAAAFDKRVERIVLVSPSLKAHDHALSLSLGGIASRAVMIVTSAEDEVAKRLATAIAGKLTGEHRVIYAANGRAGVDLFARSPHLAGTVSQWLVAKAGAPAGSTPAAGDFSPIATTGDAFGK